jgi:hypothetical protein
LVLAIREHRDLADRLDLIARVKSVGLRTAVAILVRMPEIGRVSREQAAALAGLAPCDDAAACNAVHGTSKADAALCGNSLRSNLAGYLLLEGTIEGGLQTPDRRWKNSYARPRRLHPLCRCARRA